MEIRKATRAMIRPLIGFYSESGCGKSYSSLLLARGLAGKTGKIVMVDSESGRGELYADVIPGGYDVLRLDAPFSPKRYIEAIDAVEESGAACGILDSVSHEWEGSGGVQDMAAEIESRSGKGLHVWNKPKMEHNLFLQRLLRSTIPWVVCIRAKFKTRQVKENGKTIIAKDDYCSPIQAEDFIFELTAHAQIQNDHTIKVTKCSHPDLMKCFSTPMITIETGEKIAAWCAGGSVKTQKVELWEMTKSIHGGKAGALETWLKTNALLGDNETLKGMAEEQFNWIISQIKDKKLL